MSHCRTSALDDHLDHRFIIFENVKHRTGLRRTQNSSLRKHNRRGIIQDRCTEFESLLGSWFVLLMMCHAAGFPAHSLWISLIGWKKSATLQ